MRKTLIVGCVLAASLFATFTRAAQPASDNASNAAYADGWQTADNGGTGFGPWTISGLTSIDSSTGNGDSQPPAGDIDSVGSRAWVLRGTGGVLSTAVRPLTGSLASGQHVSFDIDGHGTTANGQTMIARLGNESTSRFSILIGDVSVRVQPAPTGTPAFAPSAEGFHVDFTLTGTDTYSVAVNVLGAAPTIINGNLDASSDPQIDQLSFVFSPSLAPNDPFYFNNIAVTPEPGAVLLLPCVAFLYSKCRRRAK